MDARGVQVCYNRYMVTNDAHAGEAHGSEVHSGAKGKNMMAIFSYLWVLIIIPFLTDAKKDPFVKFHLKQGLTLIVFEVIGWVVAMFIGWFPILGWLLVFLWWLASLILVIVGIVNVLHGREKDLPWIGQYAKNFKF